MQKKAMTLVEIIIALFVFAVGILAVVRVITTNIAVIDTMKLRLQAQSLAKEGIDLMFNIRDTNLERGMNRQCAYLTPEAIAALQNPGVPFGGQLCAASFADNTRFRVSLDPAGKIRVSTTTTGSDFLATFQSNQLLTYTGTTNYTGSIVIDPPANTGTGSYFARYISFAAVTQSGAPLDANKLLKISSHVLYKKGSIKGEVVLESFIGAIKK